MHLDLFQRLVIAPGSITTIAYGAIGPVGARRERASRERSEARVSASFELDAPDHFTAGAVGPPGQRVFYLQAREGGTLVTLKCEKEQVRRARRVPVRAARRA